MTQRAAKQAEYQLTRQFREWLNCQPQNHYAGAYAFARAPAMRLAKAVQSKLSPEVVTGPGARAEPP